tara:strand:+ start:710 stop:1063 length:354 start_codon:yes stop_codon:yes gene_type:complete
MVLRLPKKKSKNAGMGKQLQDYIDRNPGRMTNKIFKLARSRKPTGRLNLDDFYNAKDSGILAGTGFGKKTQSKGPAGKVMKKKRGGKVDATNLNIKKKYGKAIKERLQSKNSRARSR